MALAPHRYRVSDETVISVIVSQTETAFKEAVQNSDEVKNLMARLISARDRVPRARASVSVYTVESYLQLKKGIETLRNIAIDNPVSSADAFTFLKEGIQDVIIKPGLVDIKLSTDAYDRINKSKPLLQAQRLVTLLKRILMSVALKALVTGIESCLEFILEETSEQIERELNNENGSVVFRLDNGLLEIVSDLPNERSDLRNLVSDALGDLLNTGILEIAEQRNRRAGTLVRSFQSCFENKASGSELALYAAGVKLFTAMGSFETPTYDDDRPPQDYIDAVKTLLIHHEAYIWTFPRIKDLIQLRKRTLESYGVTATDRTLLQSALLRNVAQADDIVGEKSRTTIDIVENAIDTVSQPSIGPEAIQYGLLRGVLQYMGRIIVQSKNSAIKVVEGVAVRVTQSALANIFLGSALYNSVVEFLKRNVDAINRLSASAQDWHWLQLLNSIIRHII